MELTTSQQQAVDTIYDAVDAGHRVVCLGGPAGTGKTVCIGHMAGELDATVVTPTNKAAFVLRSKGLSDAATLYSRFFILEDVKYRKPRFVAADQWSGALPPGKIDHSPVTIVDEASMLNSFALEALRRMADVLVLVGDPHQLPPVGEDGYFVTAPLNAELTEVLRQGEGSPILDLATGIRTGRRVNWDAFSPSDSFADQVERGVPFVVFTNKERARINAAARQVLGFKGPLPQPGDRMICRSNYSENLLNGVEVVCRSFEWAPGAPMARVKVEGQGAGETWTAEANMGMHYFWSDQQRKLEVAALNGMPDPTWLDLTYAYAITAHAAQGSEWPEVCVIDQRDTLDWASRQPGGQLDMPRRWLYTAVTRARSALSFAHPNWVSGGL